MEFNLQTILPVISNKPVTGGAFTQARYKIKPELFRDLVKMLDEPYQKIKKKLWKGHLLFAGDGSTLNLPSSDDIKSYFGVHATSDLGVNRYLARTIFLYDVLNDFVVDARISKMEKGEKTLLRECLPKVSEQAILLLDRGFGHFCTIKELMDEEKLFCIRLSTNSSNFSKRIMGDDRTDFITEWVPSEKEKENSRKNSITPAPIKVRVVKIKLNTGETELLVTNLYDEQKYGSESMGELYDLRWGVEEGFKNLKPKMKIEQFGCRKSEGVFQEFYAHIFCMNIVSLAGTMANEVIERKTSHRKWRYKYNWKNAYRFVREKIMEFLYSSTASTLANLLDLLIKQIVSSIVAVKPDRKFARDMKDSNRKGRITQFNK